MNTFQTTRFGRISVISYLVMTVYHTQTHFNKIKKSSYPVKVTITKHSLPEARNEIIYQVIDENVVSWNLTLKKIVNPCHAE